ncbi:MAG: DUF4845 domain-containing protein [Gammaproteobacteria bacterium]|nr:DUF4845 domain-containing protein [Gammaproteobacteria bacterium]MCP4088792.1 DUF4845 domain-containing protein [Gammaproteobacteria bacterium]MCP4275909.1 DUF4845 domain-containing protein [Gammaproteobacteria bacterium]MCP4832125.1 DUF4845 domain-containing protein [Gammaproteobacteria bacterium]MCP4928274.1 DUF4845 domain-containing protein [Gammaproteobacteria bacterium]
MRNQQRGMTTIGFAMLLALFGLIAFGVIQLIPVYLENMKVVQLLNGLKSDLDGQNATLPQIKTDIDKYIDIESLSDFDLRSDFLISRSPNGFLVSVEYERQRPYLANVSLLAEFEHEVEIIR